LFVSRILATAAALAVGMVAIASQAQVDTIAHWSFASATLTTDGSGNILGVADATGNHSMSLGLGIGGSNSVLYSSTTIPGSASVAGKFGRALTLTGTGSAASGGGSFLTYPNLTELMNANGAPSYTVSMWITTTNTSFNGFTALADWGNRNANPGRFTYAFGPNSATQMRGQARFNTSGTGNGTDIFARTPTTLALNDGNWHMLTWTFDSTAGQLNSYLDGALVETFNSTAASYKMVDGSSALGTLGLKGDSGNFISGSIAFDEIWVIGQALPAFGVQSLFTENVPVIPEPGTSALAGVGVLVLGGVVWFRRRA
jgi:hypothetical protein